MKFTGLRAMVIDDSPTITRALVRFLEEGVDKKPTGIATEVVLDGLDALPRISEFKPDIIFLDVNMKRSDGFQICTLIKSHPRTKHIPVVMVTGKDSIFDKARGANAMADGYVPKPFQHEQVISVVERFAPERFRSAKPT